MNKLKQIIMQYKKTLIVVAVLALLVFLLTPNLQRQGAGSRSDVVLQDIENCYATSTYAISGEALKLAGINPDRKYFSVQNVDDAHDTSVSVITTSTFHANPAAWEASITSIYGRQLNSTTTGESTWEFFGAMTGAIYATSTKANVDIRFCEATY